MTTKRVRDLTYDDLGKQVQLIEENGDKSSGVLKMLLFTDSSNRIEIGNSTHSSLHFDQEITFL